MGADRLKGLAVGLGGIVVITPVFFWLSDTLPHSVPALFLLLPISLTGVLADRTTAAFVALIAAVTYAIAFLPPIGGIRIGLTEDVFVFVAFLVVALVVSSLAGPGARAEAEVLDDQRVALLRSVSHDLRNPLSTIRAASTDLLGDARYDDEARDELLELMAEESDRLDRIVGNLLSVSRVQAGALVPSLAPEPLDDLVAESVARLARFGIAPPQGDLGPAPLTVLADRVQVDQVLTNLLENAHRHATRPGAVRIAARADDQVATVSVSDDGRGFDADALRHRFQAFSSSGEGSVGLGLTVCKAIVEAHGGTITIGEEPAGGARVSFTLPLATSRGARPGDRGPGRPADGPGEGTRSEGLRGDRGRQRGGGAGLTPSRDA